MKAGMYGFMVLGLLFFGFGCYFVIEATFSTNWDQVEGEIVEVKIPARIAMVGSATQRHLEYSIEATYKYQVEGNEYLGTRYSLGSGDVIEGGFNQRSEARVWLKNSDFAIGKKVKVYVKPNRPSETVLSSGINMGTITPILMGLLFLFAAYGLRFAVKFEENHKKTASVQNHS